MSQTVSGVTLPQGVVAEDHRFERAADSAALALMRLRWHWTLDESNSKRVSIRAYAAAVGKNATRIHDDAHGYALLERGLAISPSEARERAHMGAETEAATVAVAQARGLAVSHVRQTRGVEVRRVREIARERAEQRGSTVEREAPKVAKAVIRVERAEQRQGERHRERHGMQYLEMEAKLDAARRDLLQAAKVAENLDLDDEERELLTHTISNIQKLLGLIDRAIAGRYGKSWNDELRVIEGGRGR